jgi:DNA-binding transcriptional regulator YiaG
MTDETTTQGTMPQFDCAAWRGRLGMGREKMAEYVGVPKHTWNKWENGSRNPSGAAARLFHVLQMIEVMCPQLHAELLPKSRDDAGGTNE